MGFLQNYLNELGETWDALSQGDFLHFLRQTGTGNGGTPPGGSGTGDGGVSLIGPGGLTPRQERVLKEVFHREHKRYPLSEYEFLSWLDANW